MLLLFMISCTHVNRLLITVFVWTTPIICKQIMQLAAYPRAFL
jgi:hypothetical protein